MTGDMARMGTLGFLNLTKPMSECQKAERDVCWARYYRFLYSQSVVGVQFGQALNALSSYEVAKYAGADPYGALFNTARLRVDTENAILDFINKAIYGLLFMGETAPLTYQLFGTGSFGAMPPTGPAPDLFTMMGIAFTNWDVLGAGVDAIME